MSAKQDKRVQTFHSNAIHHKEEFECSFHSRKNWSRVTWIDCHCTVVLWKEVRSSQEWWEEHIPLFPIKVLLVQVVT